VDAFRVGIPLKRPFPTARGLVTIRKSWILRLRDPDSHDGFGEIALDPAASAADDADLGAAVRHAVAELAGRGGPEYDAPDSPTARAVTAGLDEALEGLLRSSAASSAATGGPESVLVNATLEIGEPGPTAAAAVQAVVDGFLCLKMKVGNEAPDTLIDRIRAVRDAVGPSISLRLDANSSWSYASAVEWLDKIAGFDIEYVEQPLSAADMDGHAALRRNCAVPIALDESVESEAAAASILAARAADVLVVKPARVGGPRAVRAIAALAATVGVPVVLSTFFETGIGTDAAIRAAAALPKLVPERAHGLATAGMLEHDLLQTPAAVVAGRIAIPERLVVDEEALLRFTLETVTAKR
jgi:L-Ala-D/L-Glu epimerase